MADNTQVVNGSGDLIRDIQKGGSSGPKTSVGIIDVGGAGAESLLSATNPLPSYIADATTPTQHLAVDSSGHIGVNVISGGGSGSNAAASATGSAVPASADYGGLNVGGTLRGQTGVNPSGVVYAAQTDLTSVGGAAFALGQQLAAASIPIVLTASQLTALTPLSTVTANAGSGTFAISASALPLPTGASTAAKQPAIGTAGTPSTDVLSIQGIGSMTPLKVDGSAVTQPVSGTLSVNALPAGSNLIGVVIAPHQSGAIYSGTTALVPIPAFLNATTSGDTAVVAGTGGKKIRVVSYSIGPVGAAVNILFKSSGGTVISSTKYLSLNGGMGRSYSPHGHFLDTLTGEGLTVNLSANANVGIDLEYILV